MKKKSHSYTTFALITTAGSAFFPWISSVLYPDFASTIPTAIYASFSGIVAYILTFLVSKWPSFEEQDLNRNLKRIKKHLKDPDITDKLRADLIKEKETKILRSFQDE